MADVTETTARVRAMLDSSPWEYSVDEDDPSTFTLEFETSVREHLRVSVIVQDEATSTIWGMPGSIVRAGLARGVLPLSAIGPALRDHITGALP